MLKTKGNRIRVEEKNNLCRVGKGKMKRVGRKKKRSHDAVWQLKR